MLVLAFQHAPILRQFTASTGPDVLKESLQATLGVDLDLRCVPHESLGAHTAASGGSTSSRAGRPPSEPDAASSDSPGGRQPGNGQPPGASSSGSRGDARTPDSTGASAAGGAAGSTPGVVTVGPGGYGTPPQWRRHTRGSPPVTRPCPRTRTRRPPSSPAAKTPRSSSLPNSSAGRSSAPATIAEPHVGAPRCAARHGWSCGSRHPDRVTSWSSGQHRCHSDCLSTPATGRATRTARCPRPPYARPRLKEVRRWPPRSRTCSS